jgi:hypothetical protein
MPAAAKSPKRHNEQPVEKPPAPSQEAIAKRAYELYLQRGSVPGYELEDWLTAEAELIAAAVDDGR